MLNDADINILNVAAQMLIRDHNMALEEGNVMLLILAYRDGMTSGDLVDTMIERHQP